MDWNQELLESLIWLGKAFILSMIGLAVTATMLARFTGWGRKYEGPNGEPVKALPAQTK